MCNCFDLFSWMFAVVVTLLLSLLLAVVDVYAAIVPSIPSLAKTLQSLGHNIVSSVVQAITSGHFRT